MDVALQRMHSDLGDATFAEVRFEIESERFRDLPVTTWLELQSGSYVEPLHTMGNPAFRLTGRGWIAALKGVGEYDNQRDRVIALRSALKDVVKGRSLYGEITDVRSLELQTSLPGNWIANALTSRLLQYWWPGQHLDVDLTHGLRGIRVPARFGSNRLGGYEAGPFPDP